MNGLDIIRMAKEASGDDWGIFRDFMPEIERFANLVAAFEREECAKLCLRLLDDEDNEGAIYAAAIRARGQS